MPGRVF
jgi:hypothetical protein